MRRRHPLPRVCLPRVWMMTDERMGDALWNALARLPRGAGVVVRHYGLPLVERRAVLARVERIARARGLVVLGAGGLVGSGGVHNGRASRGLRTAAAHDRAEIVAAVRAGVDAVFVSPVFATRSHVGARGLGVVRFGLLMRGARVPVIALGGMDARRVRRLRAMGVWGWAGIDAWVKRRR
ncbi:thiamine monophosphate synthase [Sphingomonas sp. Leaf33]|uniref:thiamine phosphate synthase n=1 Tax=Sphingomonas sp. Leaf33 TaxID=1736215 RepID=UPI000700891C|nr:thiamine phosphate synthase [Sphingomonas sp. Leaf33]KQN24914.1 thiamine monophosphate synthase [Sphingomonas sp. Leaf33]